MGALNKLLNIVILLLAVIALVCGFALFQKRQQLRTHSDELAQTLEKVVATIAPDTALASEAKYNDGQGSLGFKNLDQLDSLGNKITEHASSLVKQRDDLGGAVADLATKFNLAEGEGAQPEQFTGMEGYTEQLAAVQGKVEAVSKRNTDLIARVREIGETVNVPVDEADLVNVDTYAAPLGKVSEAVTSLRDRSDKVVDVLETVVTTLGAESLGVAPADLRNPDKFDQAVSNLEKGIVDVSNQVKKYDEKKQEADKLSEDLARTVAQLNAERENLATTKVNSENAQALLAKANDEIVVLRAQLEQMKARETDPNTMLYGKVIEVNYNWQYAIIDLGRKKSLPPNLTMTVGRDREFIANVQVSRVYADYAVVEILPDKKQGEVLVGDTVFYLGGGTDTLGTDAAGGGLN